MRQCPKCQSNHIVKNGRRKEKQNYLCRSCHCQFVETYAPKGYSAQVKQHCLTLYCNGMGFRAIERSTGVCHNTVINWVRNAPPLSSRNRVPAGSAVKQAVQQLPNDENYELSETTQIDE